MSYIGTKYFIIIVIPNTFSCNNYMNENSHPIKTRPDCCPDLCLTNHMRMGIPVISDDSPTSKFGYTPRFLGSTFSFHSNGASSSTPVYNLYILHDIPELHELETYTKLKLLMDRLEDYL